MGERTTDKRDSTTESKDGPKIKGWIRIHSDDIAETPRVDKPQDDEPGDTASQGLDHRVRKLEKPIEGSK